MGDEMGEVAAQAIEEVMVEAEEERSGEGSGPPWFRWVALSSSVMAVMAAIAALLAGNAGDDATIARTKEIVAWSTLETDRLAYLFETSQGELLAALGQPEVVDPVHPPDPEQELADQDRERRDFDASSEEVIALFELRNQFSYAITLFQVSIALGAVAMLARRRSVFWVSLVTAAVGLLFMVVATGTYLTV